MRLNRRNVGDTVVVDVDGGSNSSDSLVDLVEELLDDGARRIVLNLRLHSFDSRAMGAATACWLKASHRGAALKLASRQPKVWDLIRILKLDRVLNCYRSEQEALDSFVA